MSPSENHSEYDVRISVDTDAFPVDQANLYALIQHTLEQFGLRQAAVDVAVVDDAAMTDLHTQYFDSAETTDVISFDLSDERQQARCFEIIVNARQALRQARQRGHSPQAELALYLVHGLLHQLGYDDQTEQQARRMHRMEDQILRHSGCGSVYYSEPK